VLLAAGGSSRMGAPKQLLRLGGRSLVRRAAEALLEAGCEPVVVVLGGEAEAVRAELEGLPVAPVLNPAWREGLATSLRCGLLALPDSAAAALVCPCDQPGVSSALFARMLLLQRSSGKPIVACRYGGVVGAPALFLRARFPELLALQGDVGARAALAGGPEHVVSVEFPAGAFDVDTPEDWSRWRARCGDDGHCP
jgi:molybdenum cofactor cytidylyltransferase